VAERKALKGVMPTRSAPFWYCPACGKVTAEPYKTDEECECPYPKCGHRFTVSSDTFPLEQKPAAEGED